MRGPMTDTRSARNGRWSVPRESREMSSRKPISLVTVYGRHAPASPRGFVGQPPLPHPPPLLPRLPIRRPAAPHAGPDRAAVVHVRPTPRGRGGVLGRRGVGEGATLRGGPWCQRQRKGGSAGELSARPTGGMNRGSALLFMCDSTPASYHSWHRIYQHARSPSRDETPPPRTGNIST